MILKRWREPQTHLYIYFLYKSYWDAEIASVSHMTGELEEKIKYM